MRDISLKEIEGMLERHKHWINRDCKDWQEMRAVFKDVCFKDLILNKYNFRGAKFENVLFLEGNLCSCYFENSQMNTVTFKSMFLINCDFHKSIIDFCNFEYCSCINDDFHGCFIFNSSFSGTFNFVFFDYSSITEGDFEDIVCLGKVSFNDVTFSKMEKKNFPFVPMTCPSEGAFVGWKKVRINSTQDGIAKLLIPADAKRISAGGQKCRCDKAIVLGIWKLPGLEEEVEEAYSYYIGSFKYKKGEVVTPKNSFNDNRWDECASGIHFFVDKEVAINYVF